MIASVLPDPNTAASIGWLALTLAGLAGAALLIMSLIDRFKDRPAPGDVRHEAMEKFATKEEFNEAVLRNREDHTRFDARIGGVDRTNKAAVDEKLAELRAERRSDMRELHTEINEVGRKVSALEEATKNQSSWLERMDSKLDSIQGKK
jgi:hypothetical protein